MRHGRGRGRRKRRPDGGCHVRDLVTGLADSDLQPVALEFEFREFMFADKVENLFDVVEIHRIRQ
ncbi:hypothetical protein D3C83_205820 [compost metagenome]